jgi:hypothetical protein
MKARQRKAKKKQLKMVRCRDRRCQKRNARRLHPQTPRFDPNQPLGKAY